MQWTDSTASPASTGASSRPTTRSAASFSARSATTASPIPRPSTNTPTTSATSVTRSVTPTHVLGPARPSHGADRRGVLQLRRLRPGQRANVHRQPGRAVRREDTRIHGDGALAALELYLPDTGHQPERVEYSYDSARRLALDDVRRRVGTARSSTRRSTSIRSAVCARPHTTATVDYAATYAGSGAAAARTRCTVASASGPGASSTSTTTRMGREQVASRRSATAAPADPRRTPATTRSVVSRPLAADRRRGNALDNLQFTYDALGNILELGDAIGTARRDAQLPHRAIAIACAASVTAMPVSAAPRAMWCTTRSGNVVEQPTRTGQRQLSYFASGNGAYDRRIGRREARFRYDAFGAVQELDIEGNGVIGRPTRPALRQTHRASRPWRSAGSTTSVISRKIPGPGGIVASRRGAGGAWIVPVRGRRAGTGSSPTRTARSCRISSTSPTARSQSSGAQPGSAHYTSLAVERRRCARRLRPVAPRRADLRPGHRPVLEPRPACC